MKHGDRIEIDGETWVIVAVGVTEGECTYVHVKHTTKGTTQRNGFSPVQVCGWYNPTTKTLER